MTTSAGVRSSAARRLAPVTVVRSYLDHLAVERGVASNTLVSYQRDLDRYLAYLGGCGIRSIAAVDATTVSGFLAHLREGGDEHPPLSATSAARAVVAVRGLHRFALRDGLVDADVAHSSVRPPHHDGCRRP